MSLRFFDYYQTSGTDAEIDALINAFQAFPVALGKKHLTAAMRRAVRPFHPALRQATPKATGGLRRSIKTIVRGTKAVGPWYRVYAVIGFGRGGTNRNRMGNHSAIVERGTVERRRKNRSSTGRMVGRAMLGDTLASHRASIMSNFVREGAVSLERAAKEFASERGRGRYRGLGG